MKQAPLTARREYDGVHPTSNMSFNGIWVVRDVDGNFVDSDQYRNDLKKRYRGLVLIGD